MRYHLGITLLLTALLGANPAEAKTIKITAIDAVEAADNAVTGTASIDAQQGFCGSGDDAQAEPFTDTLLRITLHNELSYNVTFTRVKFVIPGASASGRTVRTKRFALVRSGNVPPYDTEDTKLYALFMDARSGSKAFAGETQTLASSRYGFKNVTVQLSGKTAAGRKISISAKTALSFDDFDMCG